MDKITLRRSTILLSSVGFLVVILIVEVFAVSTQHHRLRNDSHIINQAGVIRGTIQRVSKLALARQAYEHEATRVDDLIASFSSKAERFELDDYEVEFFPHILKVQRQWGAVKASIDRYNIDATQTNLSNLLVQSEKAWDIANQMVFQAQLYSEKKVGLFKTIFWIIGLNGLFVAMVATLVRKFVRKELEFLASHDSLTSALNRTAFNDVMARELSKDRTQAGALTLLILDIDHFKKINDRFGHQTGDAALKEVSALVREYLRTGDLFFRVGGEEFALVLPGTTIEQGKKLAERIRAQIEKYEFSTISELTVSIGGVELRKQEEFKSFADRADMALYQAKDAGRNAVAVL